MSILGCTVKALNNHNNNMVTLPALKWPIAPLRNTMQKIFLLFVQILSWIFLVMGGKYKKNTILTRIFLSRHFKTFQEDAGATSIKLKKEKCLYCAELNLKILCKAERQKLFQSLASPSLGFHQALHCKQSSQLEFFELSCFSGFRTFVATPF